MPRPSRWAPWDTCGLDREDVSRPISTRGSWETRTPGMGPSSGSVATHVNAARAVRTIRLAALLDSSSADIEAHAGVTLENSNPRNLPERLCGVGVEAAALHLGFGVHHRGGAAWVGDRSCAVGFLFLDFYSVLGSYSDRCIFCRVASEGSTGSTYRKNYRLTTGIIQGIKKGSEYAR